MSAAPLPDTSAGPFLAAIREQIPHVLTRTSFRAGVKYTGKVRDVYDLGDRVLIATTDRLSAFDRSIANIPFKGAALNLTSAFWFESTRAIVPNHVISTPHPNLMLCRKCTPFKIEFVVRAYLTGSTSTSIWTHYKGGSRLYCGHALPDGLKKNERLPATICTPTTKDVSDKPISGAEVVSGGFMTEADWRLVESKALELFAHGAAVAARSGLILVDTKYEFGVDAAGVITLIDEIHTPDSSRFWLAASYEARLAGGLEPESLDKEFFRLWYRERCDPYARGPLPEAPAELVAELSRRYLELYQRLSGRAFDFGASAGPPAPALRAAAAALGLDASAGALRSGARVIAFFERADAPAAAALRALTEDARAAAAGVESYELPEGGADGGALEVVADVCAHIDADDVRDGGATVVVAIERAGGAAASVAAHAATLTKAPIVSIFGGDPAAPAAAASTIEFVADGKAAAARAVAHLRREGS